MLGGDIEESLGCLKLPGDTSPEIMVFNDLKDNQWPNLDSRFGVGAGTLFTILEEAMLDPDHHK